MGIRDAQRQFNMHITPMRVLLQKIANGPSMQKLFPEVKI